MLLWAATLTWTLVLNVYVPIYDTVLVVLSLIVSAGVIEQLPGKRLRRFTPVWLLIIVSSWLTVPVAQHTGVQMMSIVLLALGLLQLAALRRVQVSASRSAHDGAEGQITTTSRKAAYQSVC
jgi:hypothetical protein